MSVSELIIILLAVMGMFVAVTALLLFKKDSKIVKTIITVLLVIILILGVAELEERISSMRLNKNTSTDM